MRTQLDADAARIRHQTAHPPPDPAAAAAAATATSRIQPFDEKITPNELTFDCPTQSNQFSVSSFSWKNYEKMKRLSPKSVNETALVHFSRGGIR